MTRPQRDSPVAQSTAPALLLLTLLLALDALLTALGLGLGAREANPVLGWSIEHLGVHWTLFWKTSAGILIGIILWETGRHGIMKGVNIGLIFVSAINLVTISIWQ